MATTTPFVFNDTLFDDVRGVNFTQSELDLINSSNLLISLLHMFNNGSRLIEYDPVSNAYNPDSEDIGIRATGTDFVRLLGHELTHFYDQKKYHLTDTRNNFDDIINNDMDEAQATAMSFIVRQQILTSTGTDIGISNRIGRFLPDGTELQGGQDAELAHLQATFGSQVTSTMSIDDCWWLASEIAEDIWGKNFLTRPRTDTNRWEDRLEETYGDDIPVFLEPFDQTLQSAELLANGNHKFTFTDDNGTNRTWVYEARDGDSGNNIVSGTEKVDANTNVNDHLTGGTGNDLLYGDWQNTDAGNDTLEGGSGNDTLIGGQGQDTMDGGADNDTFIIEGTDTAYDIFQGGDGTDTIKGADIAGSVDDTIRVHNFTNHGIEVIDGGAGINIIAGTNGDDTIDLSGVTVSNIDCIKGGDGKDTITGTAQVDHIYGGEKDDVLIGGAGADYLEGGAGADILTGGADNDIMVGGDGVDTYIIEGNDTIVDTGLNYIVYQGETLAGPFVRDGASNVYRSLSDSNFTLTFNSPGHLVLNDTDSITFELQTSAADFVSSDFGIGLYEAAAADRVLTGMEGDDVTSAYALIDGYYVFNNDEFAMTGAVPPNLQIDGGAGNDQLIGLAGSDYIIGGSGNDLISGEFEWTSSDPTEYALLNPWGNTGMADILKGDTGMDVISGGYGDDILSGGADNDFLAGGVGNDTACGDSGNDVVTGSAGNDMLSGHAGNDLLYGDGYLDLGVMSPGDISSLHFQMVYAVEGYATSVTLENFNVLDAPESGDDILFGGFGNDVLQGGGGNDTLHGEGDNDTLIGGSGDDQLYGGDHNDWLVGDDGTAAVIGNDSLYGGDGDDRLSGGRGNDLLYGGKGSDIYQFARGDGLDLIYEIEGASDSIQFDDIAAADVTVKRYQQDISLTVNGSGDALVLKGWFDSSDTKIEQVEFSDGTIWDQSTLETAITVAPGTDGEDELYGGAGNDFLEGLAGNDLLDGGSGDDLLNGGLGDDIYVFNPGSGTDIIQFDAGGNDTLKFGTSYDSSSLSLIKSGSDMVALLNDGSRITVSNWFSPSGASIERFAFSDGIEFTTAAYLEDNQVLGEGGIENDILYGYEGRDFLNGDYGRDYLFGYAGEDTLIGGPDRDYLYGGLGSDLYLFERGSGADIIIEDDGENIDKGAGNYDADTVRFGSDITKNDFALTWDGATWNGYSLNLRISGTADVLEMTPAYSWHYDNGYYARTGGIEKFEFADGSGWLVSDLLKILMNGTESNDELYGTDTDSSITGHGGNDWLEGFEGNDSLDGGDGHDALFGGAGSDILIGGAGDDSLESSSRSASPDYEAYDTLYGGAGNDYLYGSEGNDTMSGGTGNDSLYGGEGDDLYLFGLGDGQDIFYIDNLNSDSLYDWQRPDRIQFGEGIATADIIASRDGDNLRLTISTSGDNLSIDGWFNSTPSSHNRGAQFEFNDGTVWDIGDIATLVGSVGEPVLIGTEEDNVLAGFSDWSDDIILGKGGNDQIIGYDGGDWIEGNEGVDLLYGDSETYNTNSMMWWKGSMDDHLDGGSGNDTLYGGAGRDVLYGGEGDDILHGDSDRESYLQDISESFNNDTLSGGAGNDILYGGAGDDLYLFNVGDGADTIISDNWYESGINNDTLSFGSGIGLTDLTLARSDNDLIVKVGGNGDQITLSDWYTSYEPVEFSSSISPHQLGWFAFDDGSKMSAYELLTQKDVITQGGSGNDELIGGDGDDLFDGGDGDDILSGGAGYDILSGGAGDDTYLYNLGDGIDIINDSSLPGEGNTLLFGAGISSDSLSLGLGSLLIRVGDSGDEIHLNLFNPDDVYGDHAIETFQFSDGSTLSYNKLLEKGFDLTGSIGNDDMIGTNVVDRIVAFEGNDTIWAGDGNDLLDGGLGDDTLDGGTGDDSLNGGDGDDVYIFGRGYGQDSIDQEQGGLHDIVRFLPDITPSDIIVSAGDSTDLVLSIVDTNDTLTISGFFDVSQQSFQNIEGIEFADGTVWQADELAVMTQDSPPAVNIPLADQELVEGSSFSFIIPENAFTDPDAGDLLSITASLINGDSLPDWLLFDSVTGTFSGIPLEAGQFNVQVTAADNDGDTVSDDFIIDIADYTVGTMYNDTLYGTEFRDVIDGLGGNDHIDGSAGNDVITGGLGSDTLSGGGGDDLFLIEGTDSGYDSFNGGDGYDTVLGSDGDDTIRVHAFSGNNTVEEMNGGAGLNVIAGNDYNNLIDLSATILTNIDRIESGLGNDTVIGSSGNDIIVGGIGSDTLLGGTGDDIFLIEGTDSGYDSFNGGDGYDTVLGGDGDDTIRVHTFSGDNTAEEINGGAGLNVIAGNDYNNLIDLSTTTLKNIANIDAGLGNDTITGSAGNDTIIGGLGSDTLSGGVGDDFFLIEGTDSGYDSFNGGEGYDKILGGDGDDTIRVHTFSGDNTVEEMNGGAGLNVIAGNDYNNLIDLSATILTNIDRIESGLGNDTVIGSSGNDIIVGGIGSDTLVGGGGDDIYLFGLGDGVDTILNNDTDGFDSILFGQEIGHGSIALFRDGDDLEVGYSASDHLRLNDFFAGENGGVDKINLFDGSYLIGSDINQVIQDMSTYAVNAGVDFNSLDSVFQNDQLMNLIVDAWQV